MICLKYEIKIIPVKLEQFQIKLLNRPACSWHFKYVVKFYVDLVNISKVSNKSVAVWIFQRPGRDAVWGGRCSLGSITFEKEGEEACLGRGRGWTAVQTWQASTDPAVNCGVRVSS